MHRKHMAAALGGLMVVLAVGCSSDDAAQSRTGGASAADSQGDSRFPTEEEIEQLARSPVPDNVVARDGFEPAVFDFVGPLPAQGGDAVWAEPPNPLSGLLLAANPGKDLWLTPALECVARLVGQVVVAEETYPGLALLRYISGVCGDPFGRVQFSGIGGDVGPEVTDEQLFTDYGADLTKALGEVADKTRVGVALVRDDNKARIVLASQARQETLEPFDLVRADVVRLSGRLVQPAQSLFAVADGDGLSAVHCAFDAAEPQPKFAFTCPVRAGALTMIAASQFPPDRVLGKNLVEVLLRPDDATALHYVKGSLLAGLKTTEAEPAAALAALISGLRDRQGVSPVRYEAAQSDTLRKLSPHFMAALFAQSENHREDGIAMMTVAGHKVDGAVRHGRFGYIAGFSNNTLVDVLEQGLRRPLFRETLLSREAHSIAIGPYRDPKTGFFGALIGVYELYDDQDANRFVDLALLRLNEARQAKNLPAVTPLPGMDALFAEVIEGAQTGSLSRGQALDRLAQAAAERFRGQQIFTWTTSRPDAREIAWPAQFVEAGQLAWAGVAFVDDNTGGPWSWITLFSVVALPPAQKTTMR